MSFDTPHLARDIRDSCLALHLQRAARIVNRTYDEALRPAGISTNQFTILAALSRHEPPSLGQLARELVMDRTTLTANLKPLENKGLVQSAPDPGDTRIRLLTLTDRGRETMHAALPLWDAAQQSMKARLAQPQTTYSDLRAIART